MLFKMLFNQCAPKVKSVPRIGEGFQLTQRNTRWSMTHYTNQFSVLVIRRHLIKHNHRVGDIAN